MDKVSELDTILTHTIALNERKNITISGVKKIESFDNEEFLIETLMGFVIVKGEQLEIIRLDTYQGNISIKGKMNSITYIDDEKNKEKEDGIFNRLFK
ncbi:MAG: sporulation protein YabP [Bacilli bacterium]|nr:sporulation protein YabP [Bacilli bacterium]